MKTQFVQSYSSKPLLKESDSQQFSVFTNVGHGGKKNVSLSKDGKIANANNNLSKSLH